MTDSFVHLHNHSHFSMLDGHSTPLEMVAEAHRLGQPAIAITDHGTQHNFVELQKAAKQYDIQPIFGMEAYMAPSTINRHVHEPRFYGRVDGASGASEQSGDVSGKGAYTHLTMLAENNEGLRNLFKFTKHSYVEGNYRKPRGDLELLEECGNGLILTTGCPSGEIQTRLNLGQEKEAMEYAGKLRDIVGKDNLFLELMNHEMSIDLERRVMPRLIALGRYMNLPLVATNDAHYARKEHAQAHEHMLAMQTGAYMDEATLDAGGKRFAFSGDGYYIKSRAEMEHLFPEEDFPGALNNTLLIAERAKGVELKYDATLRPEVPIPDGHTLDTWFRHLVYEGAKRRWGAVLDQKYIDRLEFEMGIILERGFGHYFLVTSDFVSWAKNNGVTVGYGRGSVGGSAVAFALDITELDPIRHNLLFERFLNPERDSPPDVDMDFDDLNRERVIQYVTEKYGAEHVANIVTFTTIGAKTGLKDSARILRAEFGLGDKLSKLLPKAQAGKEITLAQVYDPSHKRYHEAEDFRNGVTQFNAEEVVKVARSVEGRVKTTGIHAAAVVISSKDISQYVPIAARASDGLQYAQFDYPTCESLGLIKFDFLGLRNLTIVAEAIKTIKKTRGVDVNIMDIIHGPMDDPKTYKLLQGGYTIGVFQLDGGGMRDLLRRMKPTEFGDIEASLALYRPGPMGLNSHNQYADRKNGIEKIVFPHPEFNEVLKESLSPTYGVVVYQEQVMTIARVIAGYSLGAADELRRAMGKKKKEILEREYIPFSEGAKKNGYSDEAIQTLWDALVPFAEYGFNKSHAAGYALLSYLTAYLKANYPAEYMAAVLNSVADKKDKVAFYLSEARKMGLKVKVPSVNEAEGSISATNGDTIVFGLGAVRGFSEEKASALLAEREKNGKFKDFSDFVMRAPFDTLTKGSLENLIHAGAFDEFGYSRRTLIANLPTIASGQRKLNKIASSGQEDLFANMFEQEELTAINDFDMVNLPEYPKLEKLMHERDSIGRYLSDHPLSNIATALSVQTTHSIADIIGSEELPIGFADRNAPLITVGGILSSVEIKTTRNGEKMAVLTIEDNSGDIEAVAFPRTFREIGDKIAKDKIVILSGQVSRKEADSPATMYISSVQELVLDENGYLPTYIRLVEDQVMDASIDAIKSAVERFRGDESPLIVEVFNPENRSIRHMEEIGENTFVNPTSEMVQHFTRLFGLNSIGRWS